jgi:uncharacterized protein
MPMSPRQMDQQMDQHFGFEARDDVAGVLSTLAADVDHDIVGWPGGPSRGPDQARHFYEALFADLADGEVTTIRRLYGDDFLVDESRWQGRAVGRPFGLEGRGRPLSFRLLHVVRFNDAQQLAAEQVWVDLASIQAQLPQD